MRADYAKIGISDRYVKRISARFLRWAGQAAAANLVLFARGSDAKAQELSKVEPSQQQLLGVILDADQKKSYDEFRRKVVELLRSLAT